MRRKGFTLVELLVVIAIIALLMGILMPALARVRQIAYRMVCGTNLSAIGRAIMVYANDNDEEYPRGGAKTNPSRVWANAGVLNEWYNIENPRAFLQGGTITSCFYRLIKFGDVTPKQFICKGDIGTRAFKLSDFSQGSGRELEDVQDFGDEPGKRCSYSYHMPYNIDTTGTPGRPIEASSDPGSPLCADRNPYLDDKAVYLTTNTNPDAGEVAPDWDSTNQYYADPDKTGNAAAHQREGQNVLFNDSHVTFARYPNVGIENDNIWGYWPVTPPAAPTEGQAQVVNLNDNLGVHPGGVGWSTGGAPQSEKDAYLVNELNK